MSYSGTASSDDKEISNLFATFFRTTYSEIFNESEKYPYSLQSFDFPSVFIHPNDMAEPAEPLVINTLSNVHVIEELIQLPIGSHTVVIANS